MTTITDIGAIASILREAGRQADFYHRRGDGDIAQAWSEIEALAFAARQRRCGLIIRVEEVKNPITIKECE